MKKGKRQIKFVDSIYRVSRKRKKNYLRRGFKATSCLILALFVVLTQAPIFSAYEAYVINVTAEICDYSQIKSMGYWKNRPHIYAHYLPQNLGEEIIDTTQKANQVFLDYNLSMRNKLKGQLLAMKFNIAYFGIGGYLVESENKTLDEIAAEADNLLSQEPPPPNSVLEEMKDLLDYLNNLLKIKYCRLLGAGGPEPQPLINKVYYDVDAGHGEEYDNEWVEIFNATDEAIDISDWIIEDNNSQDRIPVSSPIPALGFAVITGSATTWGYWTIPEGVIKIVLEDGVIGNGLANTDDRVILKNLAGEEVDAMSYGGDTYAYVPSSPDVDEGHILGRVLSGFDTDQSSDFGDLGLPGVTVILPNGGEKWWIGRTYTLQWQAINPNGEDSDLSIDIWYSRDSGATWANIVRGTENDGAYDWRIPLFINGYFVPSADARIKVVAFGPENFMMQGWDMSDDDFCPPIDYELLTSEELAMLEQLKLNNQIPQVEAPVETRGGNTNENVGEIFNEIGGIIEEGPAEILPLDAQTTTEPIEGIVNIEEFNQEEANSEESVAGENLEEAIAENAPEESNSQEPIEEGISETIILPENELQLNIQSSEDVESGPGIVPGAPNEENNSGESGEASI